MKNSQFLVTLSLTGAVLLTLTLRPAVSQVSGSLPAFVRLQTATPGTQQTGHSNISGTVKAGQFVGGGAGLTGVLASGLTLPMSLTSPSPNVDAFKITTSSVSVPNAAITGVVNGGNAKSVGVKGTADGIIGYGVSGEATGQFGVGVNGGGTFGVSGTGDLVGVQGFNTNVGAIASILGKTSSSVPAFRGENPTSNAEVELVSGKGAVWTNGHYYKDYTGGTRANVTPLAYGVIGPTGTVLSGTGNFTVAKSATGTYEVTIDGESYGNGTHVVTLTPVSSVPLVTGVTNPGGGAFRARIWNLSSTLVDNQFQFTVWTNDPQEPNGGKKPGLRP